MKKTVVSVIFGVTFLLNLSALANERAYSAEATLKKFQFEKIRTDELSCTSPACRLYWGAAALAVGDAGEFSRRVSDLSVEKYADSIGMTQDFMQVRQLQSLPATEFEMKTESFGIPLKNEWTGDDGGFTADVRPVIEVSVNGDLTTLLLDSGASFHLWAESTSARNLTKVAVTTLSSAAFGGYSQSNLATSKSLVVGDAEIRNGAVLLSQRKPVAAITPEPVGQIGYDLLMRFRSVTIDMVNYVVLFNSSKRQQYCVPMELLLNENKVPVGLSIGLNIDGQSTRARIDTGATAAVVLHGRHIAARNSFTEVAGARMVDGSGTVSLLEKGTINVSLGGFQASREAIRVPMRNPTSDITLGINFFRGMAFTFDFESHSFCFG